MTRLGNWLRSASLAIYAIWLEGIAHSYAGFAHPADLRQQFEHTFTSCRPPFGFWVAEEGELVGY